MAISKLASVKIMSPNHSGKRTKPLSRITWHVIVGQVTAERGCKIFEPKSKQASANYVVGYDGSIGCCVDEDDRSWCTSSADNDQQAITVEIASETTHPYAIRDAAYDSTKDLTIDIMRRHGKSKLVYIPDKDKALAYTPAPHELLVTQHRWFANKACPGAFMISVTQDLVDAINRELGKDDVLYAPMYRVQVGAFKSKANAENYSKIVAAAGFDVYIKDMGDGYYRVQMGAYRNKESARWLLQKVKAAGFDAYLKETVE